MIAEFNKHFKDFKEYHWLPLTSSGEPVCEIHQVCNKGVMTVSSLVCPTVKKAKNVQLTTKWDQEKQLNVTTTTWSLQTVWSFGWKMTSLIKKESKWLRAVKLHSVQWWWDKTNKSISVQIFTDLAGFSSWMFCWSGTVSNLLKRLIDQSISQIHPQLLWQPLTRQSYLWSSNTNVFSRLLSVNRNSLGFGQNNIWRTDAENTLMCVNTRPHTLFTTFTEGSVLLPSASN